MTNISPVNMAHLLTTYSVIFSANKKCRLSGVTTRKRLAGNTIGRGRAYLHFILE